MAKNAVFAVAVIFAGVAAFAALHFESSSARSAEEASEAAAGAASFSAVASTTEGAVRIPIFIYHSVRPDFAGESAREKQFSITPELFEQQLQYLQTNGYTVISLEQATQDIENGTTSPVKKPVVLTFDDGWHNQFVYAFPLLKKYHDTATFFVYTDPIGKKAHFMTWDELKELQNAGMTIGDHTLSHPYLSKLTPSEQRAEVLGAKQLLESRLGTSIVDFASPFGHSSDTLIAILTEAGFRTGRTTYRGAYHAKIDLLHLTGFLVHRDIHDFVWALEDSP